MAKTYSDILQEIQQLQQRANELKAREVADVIDRVKQAISVYNLSAADLGLTATRAKRGSKSAAKPAKAPAKSKKAAAAAKYQDAQGNVWSGRGPRPKWLKEALAGGAALESFAA